MTRRWMHGIASAWWGDRNIPPVEGLKLIRETGFDTAQWAIDISQVVTAPRVYDFATRFDKEFANFVGAGFRSLLLKPMWAPPHMSEGKPTYMEYVRGVAVYTDEKGNWRYGAMCGYTEDGVRHEAGTHPLPGACGRAKDDPRHFNPGLVSSMDRHQYFPEKPYAVPPNIPHIDPSQMYDFAVAVARHVVELCAKHGFDIREILWSIFNELGVVVYWPPNYSPPYEVAYDRFVAEVWTPFVTGVRSVIFGALFVGPEADTPGTLNFFLEAVKRAGAPMPDAISGHLYAPSGTTFPEGVIAEIERPGGWRAVMERHGFMKLMNTEYGGTISDDGHNTIVDGTRVLIERYSWITGYAPLDHGQWVEGGQDAWNAGKFVPNQTRAAMRTLILGEVEQPPTVRVLTEFAYRITDMKKCKDAEGTEYLAPQYLFIAVREPKLIVARTTALNMTRPFEPNDYMIVVINNDALTQGDQTFAVHLLRDIGPPYVGKTRWSELPACTVAELGYNADGRRRRGARS